MEQMRSQGQQRLEIWSTITLGEHRTPEEYRQAMRSKGMYLSDWGSAILDQISCSQERAKLALVKMPVGFLEFQTIGTCRKIYEKAKGLGLRLCPAEAGPALRLQYPGTYHPKWTLIAMESITDAGGQESIFRLAGPSCCRGPELTCALGHCDTSYGADTYFVFALSQ